MDVSEVTVSVGTVLDNMLLLSGAVGIFCLVLLAGFLVAVWLREGIALVAGLLVAAGLALGFLSNAAAEDWRPISRQAYDRAYNQLAETEAQRFWAKYLIKKDESQPDLQGPVIGREVEVDLEVTRVDYIVRFGRRRSTATPHSIRVEGKDPEGRLWVFFNAYLTDSRNATVGDKLRLQLKLHAESFGPGYIRPNRISWRS